MNDQAHNKTTTALAIVEEILEGEFTVSGFSGYYCRWCGEPLDIKSENCPNCKRVFLYPTPLYQPGLRCQTTEQGRIMSLILRDRTVELIHRQPYHKAKPGWEYGNPNPSGSSPQ